jgi:hypothetical protein
MNWRLTFNSFRKCHKVPKFHRVHGIQGASETESWKEGEEESSAGQEQLHRDSRRRARNGPLQPLPVHVGSDVSLLLATFFLPYCPYCQKPKVKENQQLWFPASAVAQV